METRNRGGTGLQRIMTLQELALRSSIDKRWLFLFVHKKALGQFFKFISRENVDSVMLLDTISEPSMFLIDISESIISPF